MGSQVVTAIGDRTMTTMIVEIMVAQLPMGWGTERTAD